MHGTQSIRAWRNNCTHRVCLETDWKLCEQQAMKTVPLGSPSVSHNTPSFRMGCGTDQGPYSQSNKGKAECERSDKRSKLVFCLHWHRGGSWFWSQVGDGFMISLVREIPRKSRLWICICGGGMVNHHGAPWKGSNQHQLLLLETEELSLFPIQMQIASAESWLHYIKDWCCLSLRGRLLRGSDPLSDLNIGLTSGAE